MLLGRRSAPDDQSFRMAYTQARVRVKSHVVHEYNIYTSRLSMVLFAISKSTSCKGKDPNGLTAIQNCLGGDFSLIRGQNIAS